jgi:hypothetical protein
VVQAERLQELALQRGAEGGAGGGFDDGSQQLVVGVL